MTQNEIIAHNNGFSIGLAMGINAKKEPKKYILVLKQDEEITGDTDCIIAEPTFSISETHNSIADDTSFLFAEPNIGISNISSIPTSDTSFAFATPSVIVGKTLFMEAI